MGLPTGNISVYSLLDSRVGDVVVFEDSCWSIVLREGKRVVVTGFLGMP